MRVLAIDVGTGTQDVLLFDSEQTIENCVKLIVPSPTAIVGQRVRRATAERRPLLLVGRNMGGGPSGWAVEDHLKAGLPVYATPEAAVTLNDDLDAVQELGVTLVSHAEARKLGENDGETIRLGDLDLERIERALRAFDVEPRYDALAVAVLDHGAAPPDVSDRVFRFELLRDTVERRNALDAFAYWPDEVPASLTRMRALAESYDGPAPLLLMDTGPAAALGALEDPQVAAQAENLLVNLGNMHTLAFILTEGRISALFEHHTGFLTAEKLDSLLSKLQTGTLTNAEIFDDMGHGALYVDPGRRTPFLAVTGPRRRLLRHSRHHPYFAVPHGDMMLSGSFGLIRALALRKPEWREEIERGLN